MPLPNSHQHFELILHQLLVFPSRPLCKNLHYLSSPPQLNLPTSPHHSKKGKTSLTHLHAIPENLLLYPIPRSCRRKVLSHLYRHPTPYTNNHPSPCASKVSNKALPLPIKHPTSTTKRSKMHNPKSIEQGPHPIFPPLQYRICPVLNMQCSRIQYRKRGPGLSMCVRGNVKAQFISKKGGWVGDGKEF